ncbi:Bug family tripartite tricarboxylate transporter substrate binding protein [Variovorax ginsengisoli]|uniref:Tripartite tricarboxylate transporter substrate binding protein n=1 Tax=Variovorax ginsengisoli TaxID=363844 RepID=A0ABT8S9P6_9BURK|nr:tripartite tricarboxylate transporter substrate binding protein [Variovorax ginsengisoli]MDN8614986.1 tripartite tricarboxylate transporter substrate binding protein [Variovorax ginsengisoli]MDO1534156.1 tripartite tricarboxylate transporter substrate binding protein [Variovorax ginsengisoli]
MKTRYPLAALIAALALPTFAQGDFPSRRITIVVSASTGGGLDGVARLLSKRMQETWNQPAIVENQGGADGLIATQRVAQSPADGYTMLLTIPSLLLLKHNAKDLSFDPVGSLAPVSELARTPSAISVNGKSGIKTFKELVSYCNSAPTPCTWGSGQQLSYLYGKRTFAVSGIKDSVNVPYKGTGPVVNDLLGGHIAIGITSIAAPLPQHRSGLLRILAVNAEQRSPEAPDVPTFREAGLNVPARGSWYGLFVPRKTPPEVVARIETMLKGLAADPEARQVVQALGAEPVFGSTRDFVAAVEDEQKFLDGLIRQFPLN